MSDLTVVEASAGTGKTYFLEHRFVELVKAGASVDQILLVTFTEKATAELRARIRALLTAEGLDTARASFDRAAIHTIHGFCQRVLVEDAFAGRRLFEQQQVPDEVAFGEAFRLALREALAVEPSHRALLAAYLRSGETIDKLEQLLLRCARAGDHVTIGPRHEPARVIAAARALADEVGRYADGEALVGTMIAKLGSTRGALVKHYDAIASAVRAARLDDVPALLSLAHAVHEDLEYCAGKVNEKKLAPAAALLRACAELLAAAPSLEAACAIAFLPEIDARLIARKARRGLFDYQDMLELVWKVLDGERGDELAARLRARHPWAMIDEFQDTDVLQWQIFRRVWMDRPGPGGLTIVGDPKQAIYSFRGADVHAYLEARDEMRARGAASIDLVQNRRSTAPMIAALEQVFQGVLGAPFFTGAIEYTPIEAAGDVVCDVPSPVHVFRLTGENGAKGNGEDQKRALFTRVADEIHAIVHERPLFVTKRGERSRVTARDIFVLTRSNAEAADVAAALRARGLSCAHRQAEHLFQTDEARDVLDLLEAIAFPRDRSRRLRAWMTSFFDVPLAQLGALGDVPDSHPLVALLHDWRGLANAREYEALFARILDDSRLAERALVTGSGARTVANVTHVFELLTAEVARSRAELHELCTQLRRWISLGTMDRPDESDVQRLDHDGDAVHVMTIHRAKGLEAAVVFVVGGAGAHPGDRVHLYHDDDGARIAHVGDKGLAESRIDREVAEENERLCYVALTRAKARLYLWHGLGMRSTTSGAYAPVYNALARLIETGASGFTVEDVAVGAPARPAAGADDVAALAEMLEREWPETPAPEKLGARAGFAVTSFSQLAHEASNDDFRGDLEATDAPIAVAPTELPAGATTGLFLHEILEHVEFASARDTTFAAWRDLAHVQGVIDAAARHHGIVDAAHLDHARDLVWKTLTRELSLGAETLPPLCRAAKIAREVEFAFPLPGARGYAKGFIDLLVAWDRRVWIVDYKSNVLAELGQPAAEREVARSYAMQARLYAIAAQRMLGERAFAETFGGLVFWFLRPQLLVAQRPTWAELERWYASLAEIAS